MSEQHPIIAVTGSSGSGTSSVRCLFEQIFREEHVVAAMIEGDAYHRYDRREMDDVAAIAAKAGGSITHFGPRGNLFEELHQLFEEYTQQGSGRSRHYIHDEDSAILYDAKVGALTPWYELPEDTGLLFYEGLHGAVVTDNVDMCQYVDLLIGVTPTINLEWIQKIQRDKAIRGYSVEDATELMLSRMYDYVHYIVPQFSRTDINFQRVPTVDTANPFAALATPTDDESFVIIHVRDQDKLQVDLGAVLDLFEGAFMSRPNMLVVPATKMMQAMLLIMRPLVQGLMARGGVA